VCEWGSARAACRVESSDAVYPARADPCALQLYSTVSCVCRRRRCATSRSPAVGWLWQCACTGAGCCARIASIGPVTAMTRATSTRPGGTWNWAGVSARSSCGAAHLACPEHGVLAEAVPFARPGSAGVAPESVRSEPYTAQERLVARCADYLRIDVGQAIVDYLSQGRQGTSSRAVFVRAVAPFTALARGCLTCIVARPRRVGQGPCLSAASYRVECGVERGRKPGRGRPASSPC